MVTFSISIIPKLPRYSQWLAGKYKNIGSNFLSGVNNRIKLVQNRIAIKRTIKG